MSLASLDPVPRLNDPQDPTVQDISSWISTRLRESNCDIVLDDSHGVELVSNNGNVDLFIPYISGSTRLEMRFPVSDMDRASSQSLHRFVSSTVVDDLDRNVRFLLPFIRDARLAFPTRSIAIEIDEEWVNPVSGVQEDGLVIVLQDAAAAMDMFVVSKQNAFYASSPITEIDRRVPTHNKFEKRVRNLVRMRYKNGIACATNTSALTTSRKLKAKKRKGKHAKVQSCEIAKTKLSLYAARKSAGSRV